MSCRRVVPGPVDRAHADIGWWEMVANGKPRRHGYETLSALLRRSNPPRPADRPPNDFHRACANWARSDGLERRRDPVECSGSGSGRRSRRARPECEPSVQKTARGAHSSDSTQRDATKCESGVRKSVRSAHTSATPATPPAQALPRSTSEPTTLVHARPDVSLHLLARARRRILVLRRWRRRRGRTRRRP